MAEHKDNKTKHLRSARQWLTRAEESFDKDHEVRGELNLFLAQAELQHVKETSHNRGWIRKYPVIRHGLAVIVAVTLASAAYGVYNQSSEPVVTMPPATVAQPVVLPPAAVEKSVAPLQPQPAQVQTVVHQTVEPAPQQQQSRQVEEKRFEPVAVQISAQRPPVSSEEMKSLIRAAGKSLRGE